MIFKQLKNGTTEDWIRSKNTHREMVKKRESNGAKKSVNRGSWTAEEDEKLAEYVKIHGEKKWRSLPGKAGLSRCGKSCRLRWLNYLRPGIKRGNISEDEEDLIIRLHNLLGNRWSLIAGRLPGRTDNEIKNHWNTHLSKKSLTINQLNRKLNQKINETKPSLLPFPPATSFSSAPQNMKWVEVFAPNKEPKVLENAQFESNLWNDLIVDEKSMSSEKLQVQASNCEERNGFDQEEDEEENIWEGIYENLLKEELQSSRGGWSGGRIGYNHLDLETLARFLEYEEEGGFFSFT